MPFVPDSPSTGRFTPAAPEQGNMYTQGAEDIVYDPMGVPLYTSSYGSAPTGATETARKGLTATAALPVNIATGVAKNVGGIAQTLGKYFGGGQTGDEMVNAINQIEEGTQKASGDLGGTIAAGGSMVGQAAPWMAGFGAGSMIPSFAQRVAQGAGTGVASGFATPEKVGLTPEQFADQKASTVALQGGLGAAFPVAGQMIKGGYNAIKGAVEPLYEQGRNRILGRALREFAGGQDEAAIQNLKNAQPLVSGSMPTVGQAAGVPSLAALERTAAANSPETVNAVAARKAAQNQAQINALEGIATPTRVAKYSDLQERLGEELYADALKPLNLGNIDKKTQTQIQSLINRPAIADAMEQAKRNAANKGMDIADPAGSMRGLHETKMALDREIAAVKGKLERDQAGSTSAELDALNSAKTDLLKFMEKVSPAYKTARETYARVSKPVEQLETIKGLAEKSVSSGNEKIKFEQFASNLEKLKKEGVLSDQQVNRLNSVLEDMRRVKFAETAGKDVGSDTVQKLAFSNLMNQVGLPNALRNFAPAGIIGGTLERVGDAVYGGANQKLKTKLAETMLDPAQAARLMENVKPYAALQVGRPMTDKMAKEEQAKAFAKMLMMQTTGQAFQGE